MSKQRTAYGCSAPHPVLPFGRTAGGQGERTQEVQRPRTRAADPASALPSALCPHGATEPSFWDRSRRGETHPERAALEEEKATSVGRGNLLTKAFRVHGKAGEGIHRRPPSSTRGAPLPAVRPGAASALRADPAEGPTRPWQRGADGSRPALLPLRPAFIASPSPRLSACCFFFPFPFQSLSARLGLAAVKVYSPSLQHRLHGLPSPLQVSGSRAAGPSRRPLPFHSGTAAQQRAARAGRGDAALSSRSSAKGRRKQPGANLRAGSSAPSSPGFVVLPIAEHLYLSTEPFPQKRLLTDKTGPGVRALHLSP